MISDIELDLLEEKQIFGYNDTMKVFDRLETRRAPTDFAILCGAFASENYYVNDEEKLENRVG